MSEIIELTKEQREILLDHMNCKLRSQFDESCEFCTVASEIEEKKGCKDKWTIEIYTFCFYCPLSKSRNKGSSCLDTRSITLRDRDNCRISGYKDATPKSIRDRVDYLIDMVNKHTDAIFGWIDICTKNQRVIDHTRYYQPDNIKKETK